MFLDCILQFLIEFVVCLLFRYGSSSQSKAVIPLQFLIWVHIVRRPSTSICRLCPDWLCMKHSFENYRYVLCLVSYRPSGLRSGYGRVLFRELLTGTSITILFYHIIIIHYYMYSIKEHEILSGIFTGTLSLYHTHTHTHTGCISGGITLQHRDFVKVSLVKFF